MPDGREAITRDGNGNEANIPGFAGVERPERCEHAAQVVVVGESETAMPWSCSDFKYYLCFSHFQALGENP